MRALFVTMILLTVALAGCTTSMREDDTTPKPTAPSPAGDGLPRLYLHADGENRWMDDEVGAGSEIVVLAPAQAEATYMFPLEPALARDIATTGSAILHVDTRTNQLTATEFTTQVWLAVGDDLFEAEPIDSQDPTFQWSVPEAISSGTPIVLHIRFTAPPLTASTFNFELGAETWLLLPTPGSTGFLKGAATASAEGDGWMARRTDIMVQPELTSENAIVGLSTVNGGLSVQSQETGAYIEAPLFARGDSEAQALARLEEVYVVVDVSTGSENRFIARIETTAIGDKRWNDRGGSLVLSMEDAGPMTEAVMDTVNGGIAWNDLAAYSLTADTTNGGINLVDARVQDLIADTTNGEVTAVLGAALGSGTIVLDTTNGEIGLAIPENGIGLDVEGDTTNGGVTFGFTTTQPVGEQTETYRHERSNDFGSADVQVVITMDTTNGGIDAGPA